MPKKLKERVVKIFFANNTKEENDDVRKEITLALKELIYKKGFLVFEILLLLLLVSVIINIVQYFFSK